MRRARRKERDLVLIDNQKLAADHDHDDDRRLVAPGAATPNPLPATRARPPEPRRSLPALLDTLTKAPSLAHLIEMIPVRVAAYLGCRRVLLYEVRDDTLYMVASTADATMQGWTTTLLRVAAGDPIPLSDDTPETRALRGERAVLEAGGAGVPTRIIAPLRGRGGPVGALVVVPADDEIAWGGDGLRASQMLLLGLEDLARVCAITLENAKLLTDNRRRADEMDLLTRLTNAFNSSVLDLDAAIGIVERQVVSRITRVDLCTVVLLPSSPRQPMPPGRWLRPEVIRSIHAPTLLDDVSVWPLAHLLPEGVRSFYAFPLFAEDRVVGVLALAFRTPHVMEESERNLLAILANTASTVLQKARLHTEAERARQHARDLLDHARNEERFKDAILRTIQSGIVTLDREGRVTLLNAQAVTVLDLAEQPALGQPIEEVMPQAEPGPHVVRAALSKRAAPHGREVRVRTVTGHDLTLAVTVAPLRLADGKDLGALCAFQDVTHLRTLEGELRRMEHVASLGNEAGSISHDLRNIIGAILMGLQKMEPMVAGDTGARLDISHMLKEINRMTALTDNLMHLTSPKAIHPTTFAVADLLERILRSLSPRAALAHVTFERHFEAGATLHADEHQIARALENLCINALEAMPRGGTLTLRTRTSRPAGTVDPAQAVVPIPRWSPPPNRLQLPTYGATATNPNETELLVPDTRQKAVEIEIADTGVGIPADRLEAIWEPYKTFGKGSKGHGLGLAIVKQIIEVHGGTCAVASEPGRGTTFTLRLPSGK
jgi:PAS domain S-box-containing protein